MSEEILWGHNWDMHPPNAKLELEEWIKKLGKAGLSWEGAVSVMTHHLVN